MKLDPTSWNKANTDLQTFLETTDAEAPVRVVLILGKEDAPRMTPSAMRRSDFGSTSDYRRALIEKRRTEVRDLTADTVEHLRKLSLQVLGGEIGRAVVAEGSARQVARALKLDGVSGAMLDEPIGLAPSGPGKGR